MQLSENIRLLYVSNDVIDTHFYFIGFGLSGIPMSSCFTLSTSSLAKKYAPVEQFSGEKKPALRSNSFYS